MRTVWDELLDQALDDTRRALDDVSALLFKSERDNATRSLAWVQRRLRECITELEDIKDGI